MNIDAQYYFTVVARTENFSKAARSLFISQTALSKTIAALEKELGVQLFERSGSNIKLSAAGRAYLPHAQRAADAYEQGRRLLSESAHDQGVLRMGLPSPNDSFIGIIAEFNRRFPEAQVRVYSNQISAEDFQDSKLDMIVLPEDEVGELEHVRIAVGHGLYAVMRADHPLSRNRILDISDLAGERLIFEIQENGRLSDAYELCRSQCRDLSFSFLHSDFKYQLELVLNTSAIAVTYNLFRMFRESLDGIVAIPIDIGSDLNDQYMLAYDRNSKNPLVHEMVECSRVYLDKRLKNR